MLNKNRVTMVLRVLIINRCLLEQKGNLQMSLMNQILRNFNNHYQLSIN